MLILDLRNGGRPVPPDAPEIRATVTAVGNFDGVHTGHRAILARAVREAAACGAEPAVWSFARHPFADRIPLLTDSRDRLALFANEGIRYAFLEDFSRVRMLSAEAFSKEILSEQCRAVSVVCGPNFHCGKDGYADTAAFGEALAASGIPLHVVPMVFLAGEPVSSTRIRRLLAAGDAAGAAQCLGRPYSVSLPVLHGKQLGRTLGFPTVNQVFPAGMQYPLPGTYASAAVADGKPYPAVTNVGVRPTVTENDDHALNAETHIIGYSGDLYGKEVRIAFRCRLRDEKRFASLDDLREQISRDIRTSVSDFSEKGVIFPCP